MKLRRILRLAFNLLIHSKLRSWLTVLGIVIGVAAVISIISIGQGLEENVAASFSGFGQDIIAITAGSSRALGGSATVTNINPLSTRELQAIKLIPGIRSVTGKINGRANIYYTGETTNLFIEGSDPTVQRDFIIGTLASGRYLSSGDTNVVIIGNDVANTLFQNDLLIGYTILINKQPYRIAGILAPASGFSSTNNIIFMTEQNARTVLRTTLGLRTNEYSAISVKVNDPTRIEEIAAQIETSLINIRHVRSDRKDFTVVTAQALQERFSIITNAITLFLSAIAAISLIVGGIGIANTMFTAVLEKTRDIGIMKAIGARNKDILLIFLFNAGMLGLVGGTLGVLLGILISYLLPNLSLGLEATGGPIEGIQTSINFMLTLWVLLFSIFIGMLFGAIPAYRASKLKPVDALRYE